MLQHIVQVLLLIASIVLAYALFKTRRQATRANVIQKKIPATLGKYETGYFNSKWIITRDGVIVSRAHDQIEALQRMGELFSYERMHSNRTAQAACRMLGGYRVQQLNDDFVVIDSRGAIVCKSTNETDALLAMAELCEEARQRESAPITESLGGYQVVQRNDRFLVVRADGAVVAATNDEDLAYLTLCDLYEHAAEMRKHAEDSAKHEKDSGDSGSGGAEGKKRVSRSPRIN